jgi:DnaK suppressor protein
MPHRVGIGQRATSFTQRDRWFIIGIFIAYITADSKQVGQNEQREKRDIMSARTNKKTEGARNRYDELRGILEERRREILSDVQARMRDVRAEAESGDGQGVLDTAESSEADIQDDIEFALIQMKSETLHKIEEALIRLEDNTYGNCFECGDEISERRLRALPFAVRCKDCEEARELAERRERQLASRRSAAGFMLDVN